MLFSRIYPRQSTIHSYRYHKRKGAALLVAVLILSLTSSLMAVGIAKSTQTSIHSTTSNKIVLQAQQYAAAEGDKIRVTAYNSLSDSRKEAITGTDYFKKVTIGRESTYKDDIKQKVATIEIYKSSDALPCYTLEVPRLSNSTTGVPIGTVIAFASDKAPVGEGVWLECNGQSCAAYPKLVAVLGSSTVPDYRGRFLETDSTVGTVKDAGLPDITGTFGVHGHDTEGNNTIGGNRVSGAFRTIAGWCRPSAGRDSGNGSVIQFKASWINSIFGKSSTVQPASVTVRRFIRAA